jgi:hypothetical protein
VIFLLIGISVHYYLMARAALNPAINEGDPETWDKMMYLLQRKQYGSRPMFPRSTDWSFQIGMFMNYFLDQYRTWPLRARSPASSRWRSACTARSCSSCARRRRSS